MKFYETLGVAINATRTEIKKAYLVLAKKLHPDKGGDVEEFKAIQKAYDVLGDAKKRANYDATGDENCRKEDPMKLIIAVFAAIIESGDFGGNIITRIVEKVKSELTSMKGSLRGLDSKIANLECQKGRVETSGENLFDMLIQNKIGEVRQAKQSLQSKIDEMIEIVIQLEKYRDSKPEEDAPDFMGMLGGLGATQGPGNPFGRGP